MSFYLLLEAIVETLIDVGAPVNAKDFYGQTALHHAAEFGHDLVTQMLLDSGELHIRFFNVLSYSVLRLPVEVG